MTFLPEQTLAELATQPVAGPARWPQRCGRLEGALEMLIERAESAADELDAQGRHPQAANLRLDIERARAVLGEDRQ